MPYYFSKTEEVNNVAVGIIGIIDIIAGIIVYFSGSWELASVKYILAFALFYLCLGIWSLATNAFKKNFFDWRGVIDLVSSFCLASIYFGDIYSIFWLLGIIIALKGFWSFFLMTTRE